MSDGTELRDRVFESLDNAVANGFDVRSWTPEFLTDDLTMCDADLERCDPTAVRSAVEEWLSGSAKERTRG
jgi:hypothetical protein